MEILKSDRSFCNFVPTLPKTYFILKINKRTPFKYLKQKLSRQIHSGAFIKIITQKLRKKKKKSGVTILGVFNETKIAQLHNSGILELLRKDKTSQLCNSEILSSLKIPSYKKLAMTSQFDLNRFHDVIICNSVFLLRFLTREFQISLNFHFFVIDIKTFSCLRLRIKWLMFLAI